MGAGISLTLLLSLGTLRLLLGCLVQTSCKSFSLSYCMLLCHVWLLSLGGLLFSEGKQRGRISGEGVDACISTHDHELTHTYAHSINKCLQIKRGLITAL